MSLPTTDYDIATLVNPTSTLTNFTLMIDISRMTSEWKALFNTSVGGYGYASDGDGNQLSCDFIGLDSTAKTGWVRVKWTGSLTTGDVQQVRIYPPNTSNLLVAVGDAYGQYSAYDGWFAYYPFDGGSLADRTGNSGTLAATNPTAPTTETGKVAGGVGLLLGNDATYVGTTNQYGGLDLTMMFWFKPSIGNIQEIHGGIGSQTNLAGTPQNGSQWRIRYHNGVSSVQHILSSPSEVVGVWQHVTGRLTSSDITCMVDGTSGTTGHALATASMDRLSIGSEPRGAGGIYDGAQYHGAARSDAWINKERLQTDDQVTMFGTWAHVSAESGDSGSHMCTKIMNLKKRNLIGAN